MEASNHKLGYKLTKDRTKQTLDSQLTALSTSASRACCTEQMTSSVAGFFVTNQSQRGMVNSVLRYRD
jgi:hypothetical protein